MWTDDEDDEELNPTAVRLGDVKRLEAFDIGNSAVVVAVRQGGIEATSIADALMKPGDQSRMNLPSFNPSASLTSRRPPFVWKVGSPLSAFASGPVSSEQSFSRLPTKKPSSGLAKAANRLELSVVNEGDCESRLQDELLYLGRRDDDVYFCERNATSFRILRLCPSILETKA
jgi:hypothetical protein